MDTEVCRKVTSFLFGTDDDLTAHELGRVGGIETERDGKHCSSDLNESNTVLVACLGGTRVRSCKLRIQT